MFKFKVRIHDDEIIGVKSTSIKFKQNPKKFLSICYSITIISLITTGLLMKYNIIYFIFLLVPIIHLLLFQISKLKIEDPKSCLKYFKSNNFFGFVIVVNLLIGKLF